MLDDLVNSLLFIVLVGLAIIAGFYIGSAIAMWYGVY